MAEASRFSSGTCWIWHPELTGDELDQRVMFRRWVSMTIPGHTAPRAATIRITADSRYTFWINGQEIGAGPPRHWPTHRPVECYEIGGLLKMGKNAVEVMVHSIGTSTSSYIPGRAGLLAEIVTSEGIVGTDRSWECRICREYESGPPRINVSQPFVERYDAREADEGKWHTSKEIGPADAAVTIGPMGAPQRTITAAPVRPEFVEIPAFSWRTIIRDDWRLAGVSTVETEPFVMSIDFRDAFYSDDITTEDRLQVGAVAIALVSERRQHVDIVRKNRRWPLEPERLWVNGKAYTIEADQSLCTVELLAGNNLLLCDVSGAYQRFWLDIVVLAPSAISEGTLVPMATGTVAAFGPFDSAAIGNIVCADEFQVEMDHPAYLELQRCRGIADLVSFVSWCTPIPEHDISTTNAKLLLEYRTRRPVPNGMWSGSAMHINAMAEVCIDFGDEVSGYLELDLELPAGARVDGVCYEYHRPDGPELPDDLNNWFRYISGGGRHSFRSSLRRGFRYLTLTFYPAEKPPRNENTTGSFRIHGIRCHERLYPTPQIATFACSDRRLTEIFTMSRRTVTLCMEDTYVDCPGFEQALWIGDTRNTALLSYVLFGAYGVARNSLITAAHSLQRSELPESHGPSGVPLILTAWSLLWMIASREYVTHSGDAGIVRELQPWLLETVASIRQKINDDGLLEISAWNMLDWAPMDTPYHGIVAHQNMLAVWALRDVADMLEESSDVGGDGTERDVIECIRADATRIKNAIDKHFWDSRRLAYRDAIHADGTLSSVLSVQTHVIALLAGVVPVEKLARVTLLVEKPETDMVTIGSPFMSFFHFRVLVDRGAHREVINEIREKWGEMIDEGSTTCWETFRGFYIERLTRSYCHAWSAAPAWFLPEVVLGIQRIGPAWREVRIEPHPPSEIHWARGSIVTPHGLIEVSWQRRDDGSLEISTTLPPGVRDEERGVNSG